MKPYSCQACGQIVFFDNTVCERCGHRLAYLPEADALSALEQAGEGWRPLAAPATERRFCANAEEGGCNWLTPPGSGDRYCTACRHNGTVPALGDPTNRLLWQRLERAKHHLFYGLLRLGLPRDTRAERPDGLRFEFLADPPVPDAPKVMTGHDDGLITIALAEADDAERERRRTAMGEPYRTLLGHFRHEIGHYYWDRLVRDGGRLVECRAVFGDEREDYGDALKRYYAEGAPADWRDRHVSAYATSHPWEDFAETFAHYLHIVDTLEMAAAFRLGLGGEPGAAIEPLADFDPYEERGFGRTIAGWMPLTLAMNSINRCMGQADLYPFVLAPATVEKLAAIDRMVRGG